MHRLRFSSGSVHFIKPLKGNWKTSYSAGVEILQSILDAMRATTSIKVIGFIVWILVGYVLFWSNVRFAPKRETKEETAEAPAPQIGTQNNIGTQTNIGSQHVFNAPVTVHAAPTPRYAGGLEAEHAEEMIRVIRESPNVTVQLHVSPNNEWAQLVSGQFKRLLKDAGTTYKESIAMVSPTPQGIRVFYLDKPDAKAKAEAIAGAVKLGGLPYQTQASAGGDDVVVSIGLRPQ